jgi:hypothetical protein
MVNPILRDNDRRVKVLSNGTPVSASPLQSVYAKYLNFIGPTVTENAPLGAYDITTGASTDEKVASYINGTQVGSVPRKLNFSSDFTGSDDAGNGRTNIGLATPAANILLPDGTTTTKPKVGTWYGGASGGNGLFAGVTTSGTLGSSLDSTTPYTTFTSAASDAAIGGFQTPFLLTRRSFNPTLKVQFKCGNTTEKLLIGLISDTTRPINTTAPLGSSRSGLGFGYDDAEANFLVWYNNGGISQKTTTATAKTSATSLNTVTLTLDDANAKTIVNFNGVEVHNTDVQPPASTTDLAVHCSMESEGTTGVVFSVGYAYLTQS